MDAMNTLLAGAVVGLIIGMLLLRSTPPPMVVVSSDRDEARRDGCGFVFLFVLIALVALLVWH